MTSAEHPGSRSVIVDDDGELRSCHGEPRGLRAEQLFAVIVLWGVHTHCAWVGWLTTTDHRSMSFSAADLEDALVRRWLCDLPGWDSGRLAAALGKPNLHLVWRCGR